MILLTIILLKSIKICIYLDIRRLQFDWVAYFIFIFFLTIILEISLAIFSCDFIGHFFLDILLVNFSRDIIGQFCRDIIGQFFLAIILADFSESQNRETWSLELVVALVEGKKGLGSRNPVSDSPGDQVLGLKTPKNENSSPSGANLVCFIGFPPII